jgi:GTP cyclohydrolase II
MDDLTAMGVKNLTRVKHVSGVTDYNRRYLEAKREWGHGLDEDDLG